MDKFYLNKKMEDTSLNDTVLLDEELLHENVDDPVVR